jgi:putative flippase GtrA
MPRLTLLQPQFLVFVAGGALCAVLDIGVMQLLIAKQFNSVMATSIGFLTGLLVNYAFHAKITFKNLTTALTFFRFVCVVGANYLITIGFVTLAMALLDSALAGKLASLPVVAVNGYLLSKYWIFK